MIRIVKTATLPPTLAAKGAAATKALCDAYDSDPAAYDAGTKKFTVDSDIYGADDVKAQLKTDQSDKCVFCEGLFVAHGHGDVEHFRPKNGYQTAVGQPLQRPGYYWLAYDWNNLFFSCQICNGSFKRNLFFLTDEAVRVRNHHTAALEPLTHTLVVNPAEEDPEKHIGFRSEVVFGKTPKGEASYKIFGLHRPKLEEARRIHLEKLKRDAMLSLFSTDLVNAAFKKQYNAQTGQNLKVGEIKQLIIAAKNTVATAAFAHAPFAGLVRANFPNLRKS